MKLTSKKIYRNKFISPEHKKYYSLIEDVNAIILKLNDSEFIKFRDYLTKILDTISKEFRRPFYKNRKEYHKLKDNHLAYIYKVFFKPVDNCKIIMNKDNYKFINSTFNDEGMKVVYSLINTVNKILTTNTYNPVDTRSLYNKELFDEALDFLEIENYNNRKVLFSEIKVKYSSKKEFAGGNMDLKEKINNNFILLRNQYETYIQSFIQ
tara:strand:- start:2629 stop:3255 length:627 start_codon:yes stop_codon:yes gene_type:complete